MRKPKYIIFDCDGVLVDSEVLANKAEVEVKNALGFPITLEEQIAKFVGCGLSHPTVQAELKRLPSNYLELTDARCLELYKSELQAIDGVTQTLEQLKLPSCVASSSQPSWLNLKLEITKLNSFFPPSKVFHGNHVNRSKPAPDLFLYAVKQLGWRAEDCLVIEDSVHGVAAGRAAGMTVCGFLGGGHIYPGHADRLMQAGAHYLISDMRNLLNLAH